MSKSASIRNRGTQIILDPTVPDVEVEIEGESYHLAFDMNGLALAKTKLRLAGVEANLLSSMNFQAIDVDTLPVLFFAALQRYHPKMSWADARKIITLQTAPGIFVGVRQAYIAAMLPKVGANPLAATRRN